MTTTQCESGEWSGETCHAMITADDRVEMRWVPDWLRGTAEAAGTWCGCAEKLWVCVACADQMLATDPDWCVDVDAEAQAAEDRVHVSVVDVLHRGADA